MKEYQQKAKCVRIKLRLKELQGRLSETKSKVKDATAELRASQRKVNVAERELEKIEDQIYVWQQKLKDEAGEEGPIIKLSIGRFVLVHIQTKWLGGDDHRYRLVLRKVGSTYSGEEFWVGPGKLESPLPFTKEDWILLRAALFAHKVESVLDEHGNEDPLYAARQVASALVKYGHVPPTDEIVAYHTVPVRK